MQPFFKHRLLLNGLKLGFEIRYALGAAIGMATGVRKCIIIVVDFVA
jgi:hypothetical protein